MEGEHVSLVALMVVAAEMQDTVNHRFGEVLGVLGADHYITQLSRAHGRSVFIDGEGEHVGGRVAASMLAVELSDVPGVDERHRQVSLPHPSRVESGKRGAPQLMRRIDEIELDYQTC